MVLNHLQSFPSTASHESHDNIMICSDEEGDESWNGARTHRPCPRMGKCREYTGPLSPCYTDDLYGNNCTYRDYERENYTSVNS